MLKEGILFRTFLLLPLVGNIHLLEDTDIRECVLGPDVSFSEDFQFGAASAAYQVEGAWNLDGKGENIWDHGIHTYPDRIKDHSNGDIAADSYHFYKEDVKALKEVGFQFYRFSISWARILPNGESNSLNEKGLTYYNNLIDELISNGIEPVITMYHWDAPQAVEDKGGFLNRSIIDYFEIYADVLFKNYGDRVKKWITFNEPLGICLSTYENGGRPPYIEIPGIGGYLCAHHLLLSHARIYRLYHEKYYNTQKGKLGMALDTSGHIPKDNSSESLIAANRANQFSVGWFAHPVLSKEGGYPKIMVETIARNSKAEGRAVSRLPEFTSAEIKDLQGTADFFGLNYYSSRIVEPAVSKSSKRGASYETDVSVKMEIAPNWKRAKSTWLYSVPSGLRILLSWIKSEYDSPEVWITENGWSDNGQLNDVDRIAYYKDHLRVCLESIKCDNVNLTLYSAWSIIDNFEWLMGYTEKFGLYHIDFDSINRERTPKQSSYFFRDLIKTRTLKEECLLADSSNRNGDINVCQPN